jgi:hypothetical protein
MREFSASHCSQALYQGTTLVGPLKATTMRALAPEVFALLPNAAFFRSPFSWAKGAERELGFQAAEKLMFCIRARL